MRVAQRPRIGLDESNTSDRLNAHSQIESSLFDRTTQGFELACQTVSSRVLVYLYKKKIFNFCFKPNCLFSKFLHFLFIFIFENGREQMTKSATRLKVDQDLEREARNGRQWFGRILAQVILLKLYELA